MFSGEVNKNMRDAKVFSQNMENEIRKLKIEQKLRPTWVIQ